MRVGNTASRCPDDAMSMWDGPSAHKEGQYAALGAARDTHPPGLLRPKMDRYAHGHGTRRYGVWRSFGEK